MPEDLNTEAQWQLLLKILREKTNNDLTVAGKIVTIGLRENDRQNRRRKEQKSPHIKRHYVGNNR